MAGSAGFRFSSGHGIVFFCDVLRDTPYRVLLVQEETERAEVKEKYRKSNVKFMMLGVVISTLFFCAPFLFYRLIADGGELIPILQIRSSKTSLETLGWCAAGGAAWTFFHLQCN